MAVISAGDAWAVEEQYGNPGVAQTLAMHWNGSICSVVPTPNGQGANSLYGVVALSADDVWALGTQNFGTVPSSSGDLVRHSELVLKACVPAWTAALNSIGSADFTYPMLCHVNV